jgi:hypothetical protein
LEQVLLCSASFFICLANSLLFAARSNSCLFSLSGVSHHSFSYPSITQTALHRAVLGGALAMVTMLLDALGDLKDARDSQGRTALHLCAGLGQGKIFKLLSRQANILLKDNDGRTTLHYAVMDWHNIIDIDMDSIRWVMRSSMPPTTTVV